MLQKIKLDDFNTSYVCLHLYISVYMMRPHSCNVSRQCMMDSLCVQVNTTAGHCQEDAGSHSNGAHSDGAHSDGAHSDGGQDTDSEKSPLVKAMT